MAKHLEHLARRLEDDPFFLACPLRLYALSDRLDEDALAARLECSQEALVRIRLCRAPAAEEEAFQDDIDRIALKFGVDGDRLMEAVRRGQALFELGRGGAAGTLLAARDKEDKEK